MAETVQVAESGGREPNMVARVLWYRQLGRYPNTGPRIRRGGRAAGPSPTGQRRWAPAGGPPGHLVGGKPPTAGQGGVVRSSRS